MKYELITLLTTLILTWPWFATSIKRFHDINMSGWWNVVFVPGFFWFPDMLTLNKYPLMFLVAFGLLQFVALILGLLQLFKPGQKVRINMALTRWRRIR